MARRRFGACAVCPEQCNLTLFLCACRADGSTKFLDLLIVRGISLAIERRRPQRTELRTATHSKRHNESPLRQQIRKKRRRSRHPHVRTTPSRWRDNGAGTIIRARGQDLVRDKFTPHDTGSLLRSVWDCSENRCVKRIEARYASREQIDERLVCRGTGSCLTR